MSGEKLPEMMPFRNFLSGRLLWDEAMATNAMEWTRKNPGGLIVGLVGADHGEFCCHIAVIINVIIDVSLTYYFAGSKIPKWYTGTIFPNGWSKSGLYIGNVKSDSD